MTRRLKPMDLAEHFVKRHIKNTEAMANFVKDNMLNYIILICPMCGKEAGIEKMKTWRVKLKKSDLEPSYCENCKVRINVKKLDTSSIRVRDY